MTIFLSAFVDGDFQVWPLAADVVAIGRSSRSDIHLTDGTVSKQHAEVTRRGDRWFIRDLGSRNGTRVNEAEAVDPVELRPGDHIELGHLLLSVTDHDPGRRLQLSDSVTGSSVRLRARSVLEHPKSPAAQERLVHVLADAGRVLVLPRPLQETCDELLAFVERAVTASRYVLMLQKDGASEPVQVAARVRGGRANEPLALSRSILLTVMGECTSVLTEDAALDPRFQGHESIVAHAVHSAMAVPLFDDQRVLGVLYVDSQDLAVTFTEDHLELLTLLANMAAVKITNARLLEAGQSRERIAQELATARGIQRTLLHGPPAVPGYRIDAFLETCYEVGGDLYDFHRGPDGRVLFLVADVTGKGMGAALLMSSFLASARVLYDACADPAELATRMGALLYRGTDQRHFVTGFLGCLRPESGVLHFVNAGHPSPCLLEGGRLRELASNGVPFGVVPDFAYRSEATALEPGATLAVFSDGITEALRGREFFGEARVREALLAEGGLPGVDDVRRALVRRIDEFLAGAPRSDDLTLVLIRRE